MPMNQKIREKRKELGLTQEQIAEYLGVSTPAVSKWESGVSYPDITLLPALARVLKTEPNVLLCFHEEPSEQEIQKFCSTISEILKEEGKEKGLPKIVAFMEQKIREYPYCVSMLHIFALTLEGILIMSTLSTEERLPYEESIRLVEALLSSISHLWELSDCPLYDQIPEAFAKDPSASILPPMIAALEQSPEYEFLRQEPSFQALIEKYRRRL